MSSPVPSLRNYLAARLRPLVFLGWAIVTLTAPSAYLAMGTANVREEAHSVARLIARSMIDEMRQRPVLWRYDAAKLQRHLDAHLDTAHTIRAIVTDRDRWRIETKRPAPAEQRPVWGRATVRVDDESIDVWVAASTHLVFERSLWMLFGFGGLATLLAGALLFVPLRAMAHAESHIEALFAKLEASGRELAELNTGLEEQVRVRSAELSTALQQLETKERRLRNASRRATAAAEADRRALSRDLHDSAGQVLTAIRIHLQRLAQRGDDEARTQAIAHQTMKLADQAVEEIRRVVTHLAPAVLDDMGLSAALTRLCEDWMERTGSTISCSIGGLERDAKALEGGLDVTCYRIAQEALTNAAKHANATHVDLEIRCTPTDVYLRINDDGCGFDTAHETNHRGRGLTGMAERVALLGGEFQLQSTPRHGTSIHVSLPRHAVDLDSETVVT